MQVIPRQLCDNAGFDATDVLNKLRQKHALPSGLSPVDFFCRHFKILLINNHVFLVCQSFLMKNDIMHLFLLTVFDTLFSIPLIQKRIGNAKQNKSLVTGFVGLRIALNLLFATLPTLRKVINFHNLAYLTR